MKKILSFICCFFLATAIMATTYYVDGTNGNDLTNNGQSLAAAFKTIQKAASVAVAGDIVLVRAGTYREKVTPANSGTAAQPILYQPYNNEAVTISGTELVTGWTLQSGSIYRANLAGNFMDTSHNQTDQVFINGNMVSLARWPNNSNQDPSYPRKSSASSFISKNTNASNNVTTVVFTDTKLPAGSYNGAEIYVQPNTDGWSWTLTGKISAVSGSQVTMTSYSSIGDDGNFSVYDQNFRYFLYNKFSLLDTAGEWFHDKAAGLLYLWCPGSVNPSTVTVEAKKREYAFDLSNRSYITVKGFSLFACTITTDVDAGGSGQAFDALGNTIYPWRGEAAGVAASSNCVIDGINGKYLSHFTDCSGFMVNQWCQGTGLIIGGSDHLVQNCTLQYSGGNGISITGRRNKAMYNTVSDMDYMAVECAAIAMGVEAAAISEDHEVGYNTITRTGRSGLSCRRVINSNTSSLITRVHHNDISNFMLQDEDGGGIYWATSNSKFIRIDHNRIHDGVGYSVSGIYPDFVRNSVLDHNIIWNVEWAFHLQGDDAGVSNHICYNNTTVVRNSSNAPYGPFNFGNNSNGSQVGTIAQNNICIYRDGNNTTPTAGYLPFSAQFTNGNATLTTNLTSTDPLFTNFSTGDFTLQTGSPAINAGTLMASVVRDGVTVPPYNDAVNGGTVDIGALESTGAAPTVVGKIWQNMPNATSDASSTANAAIIDGNKTTDIIFTEASLNYYQAAGITWATAQNNITQVKFTNGTYGGTATDNGCFEANFKLQTSTDGTTWTDATGWTLSPAYAYNNVSVSGATFTFSGNTANNVKGVRVVGQVHTNTSSGSWMVYAREVEVVTGTGDTQAPTVPTNLSASAITTTSFTLSWTASTDNVAVTSYDVYRNGTFYSNVTGTSASITGLTASTTYAMTVRAKDAAGNNSAFSTALNVTTSSSSLTNIALSGTGKIWQNMSSATTNNSAVNNTAINDGNKTADILFTEASLNYYQGGGVTWGTAKNNITQVTFTNGTFSGNANDNGCFEANFRLQTSTNGSSWSNATGWTLTPAYAYSNGSVSGATFTFSGNTVSNVKGIRVVGQVHTSSTAGSWMVYAREVEVFSTTNGARPVSSALINAETDAVKIYPNPSAGIVSVQAGGFKNTVQFIVKNAAGVAVYSSSKLAGSRLQEINLTAQPSGVYFVEISDGEKRVVKKVTLVK